MKKEKIIQILANKPQISNTKDLAQEYSSLWAKF